MDNKNIHPTAIISPEARIGSNVKIGPYCTIGPDVTLEEGVELKSHIVIDGITKIGTGTIISPFASIGGRPQDLKYKGEKSRVEIGKNNDIREYVTIQPGTEGGTMLTSIGDNCLLMVGAHVAHDCDVGNNVILANYVSLAGHVSIEDSVRIGGLSAVQQYVKIGRYAMVGGLSALVNDLIPFGLAVGNRARLEGMNLVGMKRNAFDNKVSLAANNFVRDVFQENNDLFTDKLAKASAEAGDNSVVGEIIAFIKSRPKGNFCKLR